MQLSIISGFLGSGKTTLVSALAKILVEDYGKKVLLIVNDVGEIGIDGQLMKEFTTDVYELYGGCICGHLPNLIHILQEAPEKYPVDHVLVEASGIAKPSNFVHTIINYGPETMKTKVLALADAQRWLELYDVLEPLLESQIKSADLIIINKIDLVTEAELGQVKEALINLNPKAQVEKISAHNPQDIAKLAEVISNV
ncbi:MAG: CobW family GTP-binding protein [Zhaonellaceae bacterium]|jgi:G3E family GTPase